MDASEFERRARNPALSQGELETLRANALAKGNREFAAIADAVLKERFQNGRRKSGGATPTTAKFKSVQHDFHSGKDAYLWLLERMLEFRPTLFESQDRWHQRAFRGAKRRYFARVPRELFPPDSSLAGDSNAYAALPGGWYANVNLNHEQKFELLLRLGAICQLEYPVDWDFVVTGATSKLAEYRRKAIAARELLEELKNLP